MANPNIATTTSIYGLTVGSTYLTTSWATILTCSSNTVLKVNSITACNVSASAVDVSVNLYDSSAAVTHYIAYTITVPSKATLVIMSKDSGIYMNESDYIQSYASVSSAISLVVSYESIT